MASPAPSVIIYRLIASVLERRFPSSDGYGTIFPPSKHTNSTNTGAIKIFAKSYEANVFPIAANFLRWDTLPKSFLQDRSLLFGAPIDAKMMGSLQGKSLTTLSSQLALLEEQLNDGREWLFDSKLPSLADISVHFILTWVKKVGVRPAKTLADAELSSPAGMRALPGAQLGIQWLDRVSSHLKGLQSKQPAPQVIKGDDAAELITSASHEPYDVVGFDAQEANRLGFKLYDRVQVAPDDTGKNFPTVGKLIGLNKEQVVIEVQGSKGLLRCHFPQIAFTVTAARPHKL
ncbi:hypothetical protein H0H87_008625 [Tephrocybe sp. NHM501043]|nr:hypothetical protein H0H87_008625 [Tephrocybe sp. NHM501043]